MNDEIMDSLYNGQLSQAVAQLMRYRTWDRILLKIVQLMDAAETEEDTKQVRRLMVLLAQEVRQ